MEDLSERLVSKSIEAFIMGLEIYNKPTIKYRMGLTPKSENLIKTP